MDWEYFCVETMKSLTCKSNPKASANLALVACKKDIFVEHYLLQGLKQYLRETKVEPLMLSWLQQVIWSVTLTDVHSDACICGLKFIAELGIMSFIELQWVKLQE